MRTNSFKIKLFIIGMLLAILTIISFNSFGQIEYKDVMRIDSKEAFTVLNYYQPRTNPQKQTPKS